MELWILGNMGIEKYGNIEIRIGKYGNMDVWKYGNMETLK